MYLSDHHPQKNGNDGSTTALVREFWNACAHFYSANKCFDEFFKAMEKAIPWAVMRCFTFIQLIFPKIQVWESLPPSSRNLKLLHAKRQFSLLSKQWDLPWRNMRLPKWRNKLRLPQHKGCSMVGRTLPMACYRGTTMSMGVSVRI